MTQRSPTVHVLVIEYLSGERVCRGFWSKNGAKRYAKGARDKGAEVRFFSINPRGRPPWASTAVRELADEVFDKELDNIGNE